MRNRMTFMLLAVALLLVGMSMLVASNNSSMMVHAAPGQARLNQTTVYLDPVRDAYVSEGAPDTNYGSATRLDVRNLEGEIPDDRRSYVGFDLSGIPDDAIISSAVFKAYLFEFEGLSSVSIQLRRVTSYWDYNTITWNNKPASSSYTAINVDNHVREFGWDVTSLVQDYWVGHSFGSSPNFGLELQGPESGDYYSRSFYSYNHGSNTPYLIVSYELPPTCPDPYEPNESFDEAWNLTAPTTIRSYLCGWPDVDYFSFWADAGDPLYLSLYDMPDSYWLRLYDPSQSLIASAGAWDNTPRIITTTASVSGLYYAYVYPLVYGAIDSYILSINEAPDLTVTDLWLEAGLQQPYIYYQLRNIGAAEAISGHVTALSIDGQPEITRTVGVTLTAGERWSYGLCSWSCSGQQDVVRVCADSQGVLPESDETNNCITETWECDAMPEISDLDLAMVTVMNSNDYVNPETFTVTQGARFRLSVFVSIITEFSDGIETFDRNDVQVKVSGSQEEATGYQDPNGQTTFSMIRTLGSDEPTLFMGDYGTTTLLDPDLYYEHLDVTFPSQFEDLNDDGVQFQSAFSDMQVVRPDWVSDVISVQLPRLRYVQNEYNDHVDPQSDYVVEYFSPGGDHDSAFLVFTFDVSTEYLNPGLWTMNVVVDEPGIIDELNEENNASGDISWRIEASEAEASDIWIVHLPEGEEESVAPGPCDPWGWGGTPPSDTMAAGVYRVRYRYGLPMYRDVPHLFMWNDRGVSKLTRNGVYIGEIFGPFGHHCTNTRWASDPDERWCIEGYSYPGDLTVVGDQPYNASCDPEARDYLACREQLKRYTGRPEPGQIENVMVFFPGVLGGDAGSMVTGQTGCSSSLGDCSEWGPNDEANAALYHKGDQFHLLRIKHDSIAGRLMGLVDAYTQYSPQDTLLTAVFDPEIDTSEGQDNELLNALEYYIAKRTNMYDNVKVIWIAGGSRGGSTAFYLTRKIKDRLMGDYGVDHYHDAPLEIKVLATGIDAVSESIDVPGCSPNISGYERLVTNAWNLGDATHGNGHDMSELFDQAGTNFHPNLHALQIIGEVRNRDSMIHIEADSPSAEQDARLPANRDADPDVTFEDLVYKYPDNGLEGEFYSQWWPVLTTAPTDAPYPHDYLTRDYRPPNGPKTLNWFFNHAGWGDFSDYDELPACPSEVCDNGIDDDRNGYTDCEDVHPCQYDDHCNERNACLNGVDDDNDGLTDCDDPDCTPRTHSSEEPCYMVHKGCILTNPDPSTCRYATGTGLYISPTLSSVPVSSTITVALQIGNIENLYGAQVELAFNPALIEVVDAYESISGTQIQEGDFPVPDVVVQNSVDNSAGVIQYNISLQGPKPGVNGSGVLARIVFRGRSRGVGQVTITQSVLSDTQSLPIEHAIENGRIAGSQRRIYLPLVMRDFPP